MNLEYFFVKCIVVLIFVLQNGSSAQFANIMDVVTQIRLDHALMFANSSNSKLCEYHTKFYNDNLKNGTLWAMQMFDSSTKIPESVLMGHLLHLGNFDECIGIENVQSTYGSFRGKHCVASISMPFGFSSEFTEILPGVDKVFRIRDHSLNTKAGGGLFVGSQGLSLSYCIPSTCSAKDFEEIFNAYLSSLLGGLPIEAKFNDGSCKTNQSKSLGAEDWVAVAIIIKIAILAISSTAYDLLKKESKNELLTAFSWYSNGKKLLNTASSGDTLLAIHGIRFLTTCWVILGHRYTLTAVAPAINLIVLPDILQDFWRLYLSNGSLSVDTFFLLGGLLVSYVFLKHMSREKASFNIPLYYLHRYIRLTPPYAMMMLFNATLVRYMSSGPKFSMENTADICQKYWWKSILYINNYLDVQESCVGIGWYLAIDMQLFILSPIILYPLWKWPKKWSLSLLGALIVGGLVTAFTVSFVEEFPAAMFPLNMDVMSIQYYPMHTRFTAWLVGVGFGYAIFQTKKEKIKLSKTLLLLGWCVGIVALLGSFLGMYRFSRVMNLDGSVNTDEQPTNIESALFTTFSRPVWALGVGWIAFACVSGYGGFINTFLSWKAFLPLSRLTYCIFLIHMTYQTIHVLSYRTASYISDLNVVPAFFGDVVACAMLATVLSLCTESPFLIIEKYLLGGGNKRRKENTKKEDVPVIRQEEVNLHTDLKEVAIETSDENKTN